MICICAADGMESANMLQEKIAAAVKEERKKQEDRNERVIW